MCQPDVGANLMFALERITLSFLCTMGEHKVRPYIGLVKKKMRNLLFKHSLGMLKNFLIRNTLNITSSFHRSYKKSRSVSKIAGQTETKTNVGGESTGRVQLKLVVALFD